MTGLDNGCPKRMHYGPCGGVAANGNCEVGTERCVFVDNPTISYPQPDDTTFASSAIASRASGFDGIATVAGRELVATMRSRPAVITGIPASPLDSASLRSCADELVGRADAVISGDTGRARVQFPPSYRAALLADAGVPAVLGLNCRDRNRVALEGELIALADAGVAAVLCLTGDHTELGDRADAAPVFDLEGTQLVPLAHHLGLVAAVPESPFAPPQARRPARLAAKAAAGAQIALLQYTGDVGRLGDFIAEVIERAPAMKVIPGIPLVIDIQGAEVLASFTAAEFPAGYIRAVVDAGDPRAAGIAAAIEFGEAVLAIPGVAGITVTGSATSEREVDYCRALGTVSTALGGGSAARETR